MLCCLSYIFNSPARSTKRLRIHDSSYIRIFAEVLAAPFMTNAEEAITSVTFLLELMH
jgi:hypothetical protein